MRSLSLDEEMPQVSRSRDDLGITDFTSGDGFKDHCLQFKGVQ